MNDANVLRACLEAWIGAKQASLQDAEQIRTFAAAAKALADHCIIAPGGETNVIQEVRVVLAHALCPCVEAEMSTGEA